MSEPLTIDDIYESAGFQLLAQSMKDKEALDIMATLSVTGLPGAYDRFNRWAKEQLEEQEAES